MLTGFEVYKYYLGVKLHFTSKTYDVVAAGGHTTVGQTAFARRRDRQLFEGLAAKFDQPREAIKYLIANFAYGHNNVIYDREVGQDMLKRWIRVKESLSRVFHDDLESIIVYAEKNHIEPHLLFEARKDGIGGIVKLMKSGLINVESVSLICQLTPSLLDTWEEFPECKMIYETDLLRIRKLETFVKPTDLCVKVWNEFKEENL